MIALAPAALAPPLKACPFIAETCLADDAADELPAHDFQIPVGSLPGAFQTTLTTIPAERPYLFAEEERPRRWRSEVGFLQAFKIGVLWQAGSFAGSDLRGGEADRRSIPLAHGAAGRVIRCIS